jgi:hypothetical protein
MMNVRDVIHRLRLRAYNARAKGERAGSRFTGRGRLYDPNGKGSASRTGLPSDSAGEMIKTQPTLGQRH